MIFASHSSGRVSGSHALWLVVDDAERVGKGNVRRPVTECCRFLTLSPAQQPAFHAAVGFINDVGSEVYSGLDVLALCPRLSQGCLSGFEWRRYFLGDSTTWALRHCKVAEREIFIEVYYLYIFSCCATSAYP